MSQYIASLSGEQRIEPVQKNRWTSTLLHRYGMRSKLHESESADCKVRDWQLGDFLVLDINMAHQLVSPVLKEDACWNGDHLFLKVVTHGSISIEQNGSSRTFGQRAVLAVDPLHGYSQIFDEQSSLAVLRIPKMALRDRGMPHSFHDVHVGDTNSPDVQVVCDFILMLARQHGAISNDLGRRITNQCLDVLDVVFSAELKSGRRRTNATTLVLRAKQVIGRLARNPDLDVSWVARELNVSPNYLTRVFRTSGQTPMRYLMELRLDLASTLLVAGDLRVKEIAFGCGFVSSSHFCSVFRREFGMSPLEFAAKRKSEARSDRDARSIT